VTSHGWDAVGDRLQATSPGGTTYYAYDALDRMEHAEAEDATLGTCYYTYDANGNVIRKVLGNGCFTYFTYDELNRPAASGRQNPTAPL